MSPIELSILVGASTLGGGIIGLLLQKSLPEHHTSDRSRDMLGAIVGLTSLLLALVLGTLVGSAYSFYANQKSEMEMLAARSLQLDLSLAQYGDEALPLRVALRNTIAGIDGLIWGAGHADAKQFTAAAVLPTLRGMVARLATLTPTTDGQKQLLPTIGSDEAQIQQTRLLMSLQLASPISWPLLMVVASWSVFLFCGFGLLSKLNVTTFAALTFGSFAIASAIFLILELNEPYSGLFRIPSGPIEQTMEALRG
jgi:cytochrome bd-type quinol oxidase subunit 2